MGWNEREEEMKVEMKEESRGKKMRQGEREERTWNRRGDSEKM